MLHIFDVSAYQGPTLRKCDAAFIKATEGKSYTSTRFAAQWASAKTQTDVRGGYHFARPEESPAKDQADRFLDVVQPSIGEVLWLDLEASKLSQSATNVWARDFGDRLWDQAPDVTTGVYLGSAYASNGTGRDLNQHFNWWWYPQYPSVYQIAASADVEVMRAENRSHVTPGRFTLAAMTSSWPGSFTPWLPPGLTVGWRTPHIWQFTDNWNGWDASVSPLTIDQLAGGGRPIPQEEADMAQRDVRDGLGQRSSLILPPKSGGYTYFEAFADNTLDDGKQVKPFAPVTLRVAVEKSDGHWQTVANMVVGRGPKDTVQPRARFKLDDKNSVAVSVTRVTGDGTEPITITAY